MVLGRVLFITDERVFCDGGPCEKTDVTWPLLWVLVGVDGEEDIVKNNVYGKVGRAEKREKGYNQKSYCVSVT